MNLMANRLVSRHIRYIYQIHISGQNEANRQIGIEVLAFNSVLVSRTSTV